MKMCTEFEAFFFHGVFEGMFVYGHHNLIEHFELILSFTNGYRAFEFLSL